MLSQACAVTSPWMEEGTQGQEQHLSLDIYFMWLHCFLLPPELLWSRVLPLGFQLCLCVNPLEKLVFWGSQ